MAAARLAACFALLVPRAAAGPCRQLTVDFILLKGDTLMAKVEDDIRADLAKIGITANTRLLEKEAFNAAMAGGDFNLCFTESWGPPYDPHSFASGWGRPNNEAHYPALEKLEPPMTKAQLLQRVRDVVVVDSEEERMSRWREILRAVHEQAVTMPMWSKRNPAVIHRRLTGYVHGPQQWDYPMHAIQVLQGPTTVRVAPGAQTGLFRSLGPKDPHSYRPNEVFFSNWVYEGLVSYGPGGAILPSLAQSWTREDLAPSGQRYTFELRRGVSFHDGTPWDCAAAKLNFDHVLAQPLPTLDWHGWYHLPGQVTGWGCSGSHTFYVAIKERYYPFLQELTLIRPLRMLSPAAFVGGSGSDPKTQNSCPLRWKTPTLGGASVTCAGTRNVSGTGPWMFAGEALRADGSVAEVSFVANRGHWGPRGNVEALRVQRYDSAQAVKAALLDGSLDMVVGAGVLTPEDIAEFRARRRADFVTVLGPELMNTLVVLNTQRPPTDSIRVRTAIMHAVNKAAIVDKELAGLEEVADSLFPKDAPYCDVDLTPRWDYDFQKASLLNCPDEPTEDESANLGLILGLTLGLGVPLCLATLAVVYWRGSRVGYHRGLESSLVTKRGKGEGPEATADTVGVRA